MLGTPETTAYDLRFRLLDIPVRIHPLFWLVMALLGYQPGNLPALLVFVAVAFFSILVHEFGHGLTARAFGDSPAILLYGMGGLCYTTAGRQTPRQRLAVLACGPGAGFLLFGLTVLAGRLLFGVTPQDSLALAGLGGGAHWPAAFPSGWVGDFYLDLLRINLLWGLINLLPIWPLDGGQMTGVVLSIVNPHQGMRWTHVVSLLTAGLLAMWVFQLEQMFMALWFVYFAMVNFQELQALHSSARYGGMTEDEADWWKR